MQSRYLSEKIVEWYSANRRNLPWRASTDPYRIWLSEIILQQTRVSQGLPYYLKFIEKYPSVQALANAREEEILRLWQGLGYYTRARNLHKCAQQVVNDYGGRFPDTYEGLKKLRGIGDYTAAAIASMAFNEPVAVVDGNVFRVLSRIFGVDKDIASTEGKKHFVQLANELVDMRQPGIHNQAVMEFGALHCVPHQPNCSNCIFSKMCVANAKSIQRELPVKLKAKAARKRYFYYFVIREGKKIALKKRQEKDIWHGLYDFYLVEKNRAADPKKILEDPAIAKIINSKLAPVLISDYYKHVLSHQTIFGKFIVIDRKKKNVKKIKSLRFYTGKQIHDLPKPVLISRFLEDVGVL
jgi:A/G-specific adenine glycosylase